jgi:hypothetical protein
MKSNVTCRWTTLGAALVLALALSPSPSAAQEKVPAPEKPAAPEQIERPAPAPQPESPHPFTVIAGSWSGGGTISLSNGTKERVRCRAHHSVGHGGKSLSLSIRCASDSYRFELTSNVVDRRGMIFGKWSEARNGVSGTISGRAVGDRIQAVAKGDTFTAGISLTTHGNRQSVSITPQGAHISGVHIALSRR